MENTKDTTLQGLDEFTMDEQGYLKAKQYLIDIGEWDRVSTTGFSIDGWSIVDAANVIKKQRKEA